MADYGARPNGTMKGSGFLGELKNRNGDIVTEYSVGVNIDGQEVDIPTVVPTLTKQELRSVLDASASGTAPNDKVIRKAIEYAKLRSSLGLDYYADEQDAPAVKINRSNLGIE